MLTYADVVAGRLLLHDGVVTLPRMWEALREVATSGQAASLVDVLARGPLANGPGADALARSGDNVSLVLRVEAERTVAQLVQQSRLVPDDRVRALYEHVRASSFRRSLAALLVDEGLLTARQAENLRHRTEDRLAEVRAERVQALKNLVATLGPRFTPEEQRRLEEVFASAAQGASQEEATRGGRRPIDSGRLPRRPEPAAPAPAAPAPVAPIPAAPAPAAPAPAGPAPAASAAAGGPCRTSRWRSPRRPTPGERDGARPGPEDCPIYGYEIIDELGKGAMGVVYKARNIFTGRVTALKVLPLRLAEQSQYLERFKREAMALMRMEHPNVVRAYDFGGSEEFYYLALEFVEGEALDQILRRQGALPERQALEITRQVALGLQAAAEVGIVHRDVKPENVMLTASGTAKLCDFGIVKLLDVQEAGGLTAAGTTVGTPFYIAPEQARGQDDLDVRSDLYSLGISLFHLATGRVPFSGKSQGAILVRHILEEVPDPRTFKPGLSEALAGIVAGLCRKKREERLTIPALISAIDAALGRPGSDRLPTQQ